MYADESFCTHKLTSPVVAAVYMADAAASINLQQNGDCFHLHQVCLRDVQASQRSHEVIGTPKVECSV